MLPRLSCIPLWFLLSSSLFRSLYLSILFGYFFWDSLSLASNFPSFSCLCCVCSYSSCSWPFLFPYFLFTFIFIFYVWVLVIRVFSCSFLLFYEYIINSSWWGFGVLIGVLIDLRYFSIAYWKIAEAGVGDGPVRLLEDSNRGTKLMSGNLIFTLSISAKPCGRVGPEAATRGSPRLARLVPFGSSLFCCRYRCYFFLVLWCSVSAFAFSFSYS